jgi:hypothetical protein
MGPARKLTLAVHTPTINIYTAANPSSRLRSICINGQETPKSESGRPKEIKAKYITAKSKIAITIYYYLLFLLANLISY